MLLGAEGPLARGRCRAQVIGRSGASAKVGSVENDAAHLETPALGRVRRGCRILEGAVKAEGAGRGRVLAVGHGAPRGRKGSRRIPLLDQQRLVAGHFGIVKPAVARGVFGEVVLADPVAVMDLEDRIAAIDYQLNDPEFQLTSEEEEIFWRERVRLMKLLVSMRYAQAHRTAF